MNSRRISGAFALLALALAAPAQAFDAPDIRTEPAAPRAGEALRIGIAAQWNDACTPRIESVGVDGFDITVRAVRDAGPCSGGVTPYRVGTATKTGEGGLRLPVDGVYRVRYEVRNGSDADPELHGFRLLQVGEPADPGFVPETGFWWPERGGDYGRAGPGLGVQLEVQSDTVSLSALGYAPDGRAGWYFGVAPLDGRLARLDMSLLAGGAGPFEAYSPPTAMDSVGQAELEVLSPSRAVLWFVRGVAPGVPATVEPVSIVRFSFAQEPGEALAGRWLIVGEDDGGPAPLRIDFSRIERKAHALTLRDEADAHVLRCESAIARPTSPPGLCRLEGHGKGAVAIEFTDVGLQQMRGWDADGRRMLAFRIDQ